MYLIPLNYVLKNSFDGKFYVILPQLKTKTKNLTLLKQEQNKQRNAGPCRKKKKMQELEA